MRRTTRRWSSRAALTCGSTGTSGCSRTTATRTSTRRSSRTTSPSCSSPRATSRSCCTRASSCSAARWRSSPLATTSPPGSKGRRSPSTRRCRRLTVGRGWVTSRWATGSSGRTGCPRGWLPRPTTSRTAPASRSCCRTEASSSPTHCTSGSPGPRPRGRAASGLCRAARPQRSSPPHCASARSGTTTSRSRPPPPTRSATCPSTRTCWAYGSVTGPRRAPPSRLPTSRSSTRSVRRGTTCTRPPRSTAGGSGGRPPTGSGTTEDGGLPGTHCRERCVSSGSWATNMYRWSTSRAVSNSVWPCCRDSWTATATSMRSGGASSSARCRTCPTRSSRSLPAWACARPSARRRPCSTASTAARPIR